MLDQNFTKKCFLLLFGLCFTQLTFAQNYLSGTILDAGGNAVEYANVFAKSTLTDEIVDGNISDENGQFTLKLKENGNFTLTVSFLGFADYNQVLDIDASIDVGEIVLENSASYLEEVVVTAERAIIEKKENKLIFNVGQSPLKTGFTGIEVLQRSPNVIVDNSGNILMRNQQARVLINGKVSNLSDEDLAIYVENLRSEEIESIEIQSHLGVNTDAEDTGGNINIILKRPPLGIDGSARMDYTFKRGGDYDFAPGININYGAEKWNVYGIYNYQKFTQVSPVLYQTDFLATSGRLNNDWNWTEDRDRHTVKLGIVSDAFDNHTLGFEYYTKRNVFDFDNRGTINFFRDEVLQEKGQSNFNGLTNVELNNYSFNYTWKIDTTNSTLKFFADHSTDKAIADNFSESIYEKRVYEDNTERNTFDLVTNFYSAQTDLEKNFGNDWTIEAGVRALHINRDSRVLTDYLLNDEWIPSEGDNIFKYKETILGIYAMVSKKLGEKNFIQGGLRFEDTQLNIGESTESFKLDRDYSNFFGSFFFSRDLGNSNSLSLSYSRTVTRPPFNFLNNYTLKLNDFAYEIGNPDLLPEFINKYELSLKQKSQTISVFFNNTIDVMKSTHLLEDEITYFQIINRGIENQVGVEYNRFGNITKQWFFKGTVGGYQVRFKDNDAQEFLNGFTGFLNVSNNIKITKTLSVDASFNYISRERSGFCEKQPLYNVDFMIQKTFLDSRLTARIYAQDIFNTWFFRDYCDFETYLVSVDHKEKTQTLRFWLSYNFSSNSKINKRTIDRSKNKGRKL